MKAVMVMFDSLNRNYLPNYGSTEQSLTQFERLGENTVTFDCNYAGSLPCMPARRELHTGRYNFLHREWGPVEPYDDSMPNLLKRAGVYTHLISDHLHYWEDGGSTYHSRYSSWEIVRGQEGDPWIPTLGLTDDRTYISEAPKGTPPYFRRIHDYANTSFIKERGEFPQEETFRLGLDFINKKHEEDNWFLQIETFDPHEPFDAPQRFLDQYLNSEDPDYNWPPYGAAFYPKEIERTMRNHYRALLGLCNECLGKVLDLFDKYDLWKDTMLIVNTDHGFLLGEKHWWGKNIMPIYNEIAHIPLFIWDPRCKKKQEHRQALTQTIDLAPTLLEYFGVAVPEDMQGKPLKDTIAEDTPVRDYALYGNFGAHINITDGKWQYMRSPARIDNMPLNCYTQMPANLMGLFAPEKLRNMELAGPFTFSKGTKLMKFPVQDYFNSVLPKFKFGNKLLCLDEEGRVQQEAENPAKEAELVNAMQRLMKETDAPEEQFERVGLLYGREVTTEDLEKEKQSRRQELAPEICSEYTWQESAIWECRRLRNLCPQKTVEELQTDLKAILQENGAEVVSEKEILQLWKNIAGEEFDAGYEKLRKEGVI